MAQKNRLTKRKSSTMVGSMDSRKVCRNPRLRSVIDVVIGGEKYCIIPRKELEKMMIHDESTCEESNGLSAQELKRRFDEALQNCLEFDSAEKAAEYRRNNLDSSAAVGFNKDGEGVKYLHLLDISDKRPAD
jgi:hypothetical protein